MKRRIQILLLVLLGVLLVVAFIWSRGELAGSLPALASPENPGEEVELPDGFEIERWAKIEGARSLTLAPDGTVFVGSRDAGNVYAVVTEGDERQVLTIDQGLNSPNGVAFQDGSLYVAEIGRILRYDDILKKLKSPPEPVVVTDAYPEDRAHGWKFIAFGPDGMLYVPVGAPCNVCRSDEPIYSSITRLDVSKPSPVPEVYASGIRNTVGFDWHPETKELWFTDNGRDHMGDDKPPDELNVAPKPGLDFGFPGCHGRSAIDPEYGQPDSCEKTVSPVVTFQAHVAALGMRFYTGEQFPDRYHDGAFIALHGSWNRTVAVGYEVLFVPFEGGRPSGKPEVFATGWHQRGSPAWGRPVDVLVMPDGSLLVSDDKGDAVYRIRHQ